MQGGNLSAKSPDSLSGVLGGYPPYILKKAGPHPIRGGPGGAHPPGGYPPRYATKRTQRPRKGNEQTQIAPNNGAAGGVRGGPKAGTAAEGNAATAAAPPGTRHRNTDGPSGYITHRVRCQTDRTIRERYDRRMGRDWHVFALANKVPIPDVVGAIRYRIQRRYDWISRAKQDENRLMKRLYYIQGNRDFSGM